MPQADRIRNLHLTRIAANPFHRGTKKRDENYPDNTFTCRLTKSTVRQELLDEYEAGKCDRYKLLCANGHVMVGKHVLPYVSGFFAQQIDMVENITPYSPQTGPTEINCKTCSKEIVQKFANGIYGERLTLTANDTVQLIRFIHGPGNFELYDWHQKTIERLQKHLAQMISHWKKPSDHDKIADLMLTLFDFPVPSDTIMTQCGKMLKRQDFEAAFGRLVIKSQSHLFLNATYEYIPTDGCLTLSMKNFFEEITIGDAAEQRLQFMATISEIAKQIIEKYFATVAEDNQDGAEHGTFHSFRFGDSVNPTMNLAGQWGHPDNNMDQIYRLEEIRHFPDF